VPTCVIIGRNFVKTHPQIEWGAYPF
jgi:hypothetical protein